MFLDTLIDQTTSHLTALVLPSQRVFWLYLLAAFVIATGTYIFFKAHEEGADRPDGVSKGLWGYIFDREVWLHRSARQDYVYFVVNGLIYAGIVSQLLIGAHIFYGVFGVTLDAIFGRPETPVFPATPLTAILYTLAAVMAADFAVFITHYLQHKVQVLWQFHQVHHSAEVLTPVTVYRMHPVDLFFTGIVGAACVALALALFVYLTGEPPKETTIAGVNVVIFVFYLVGYNLRHSHIWLGYPRWLSFILISPAQHQTHHSVEVRHFDKNFGLVFAFWDWMFGTLYVPKGYEKLSFGINRSEPNPFSSVRELYLKPFANAWEIIAPREGGKRRRIVMAASVGMCVAAYGLVFHAQRQVIAAASAVPSVHLEDLTWTEIARAQDRGFDTVIIPTGGTEQNGPHVILGKHNYIIHETAERIARALDRTLVAPVLSYVPEGDPATREGHMAFAGTLSLPEPLFQSVLEAAAASYKAHGFRNILLIGDSGGNQAAQAEVAQRLTAAWADEGVRVLHVGAYYAANGQIDWLRAQGFTDAEIGSHAGIRDTSELIAVNREGVRMRPVEPPEGAEPGYSGAPSRATAEIGEQMLMLKVEAALRQIREMGIEPRGAAGDREGMGASILN
ncbi:creatininase family protein [Limibaculum sp. M0105]|uniref:Creatininase family protein n=1 Tax=Thermohalobaculum xanthum TaxID=2753746 RepID=A0A8J7M3S9_9RHOB|nr:creatininase family protein [Thermohalobaculum xanthum]MBK0397795.1 creatininase family protein [Thermohalobaculum xanthum]